MLFCATLSHHPLTHNGLLPLLLLPRLPLPLPLLRAHGRALRRCERRATAAAATARRGVRGQRRPWQQQQGQQPVVSERMMGPPPLTGNEEVAQHV